MTSKKKTSLGVATHPVKDGRAKTVLRLRDPPPKDPQWLYDDVQRIVKAFNDAGYEVTYRAAKTAWEQHSADSCAGWLSIDSYTDENLVDILLEGTDEDDVTLNGRENGPFLVNAATGEKVKR